MYFSLVLKVLIKLAFLCKTLYNVSTFQNKEIYTIRLSKVAFNLLLLDLTVQYVRILYQNIQLCTSIIQNVSKNL